MVGSGIKWGVQCLSLFEMPVYCWVENVFSAPQTQNLLFGMRYYFYKKKEEQDEEEEKKSLNRQSFSVLSLLPDRHISVLTKKRKK